MERPARKDRNRAEKVVLSFSVTVKKYALLERAASEKDLTPEKLAGQILEVWLIDYDHG